MPPRPTESTNVPEHGAAAAGREQRLARALADMAPEAATIRVTQRAPGLAWPTPLARAYDQDGQLLPLSRTQRICAARWIMRTFPDRNWDEAHEFELTTGTLRRAIDARSETGGA